jgi:hypothetical protein
MSLILQSSGGGQITIQEPATASNFTQSLPAATGTVALLQTPSFATTIGVGGATPAASGAGITFPATQSASADANTLDDYEEGSWTPVGNVITLTSATGIYTKIGNIVSVSAQWTYPLTADTNPAQIDGLPFVVTSTPANYNGAVTVTNYGSDNLYLFTNIGSTNVLVRNNGNTDLTNANLSNKFVTFMATYRVA